MVREFSVAGSEPLAVVLCSADYTPLSETFNPRSARPRHVQAVMSTCGWRASLSNLNTPEKIGSRFDQIILRHVHRYANVSTILYTKLSRHRAVIRGSTRLGGSLSSAIFQSAFKCVHVPLTAHGTND